MWSTDSKRHSDDKGPLRGKAQPLGGLLLGLTQEDYEYFEKKDWWWAVGRRSKILYQNLWKCARNMFLLNFS